MQSQQKRPVVVIAVPCPDTVCSGFANALAWLCIEASKDFDIRPIQAKSSNVAIVRNMCVAAAKMHRAEWILWLDSDQIFPRDTLHRLMAHGKELVGATYPMRMPPFSMLGLACKSADVNAQAGIIEMEIMPFGCFLMKMSVIEKLDRPYFRCPFDELQITGEDTDFCMRVRDLGFQVWNDIDLSKEIGHIGSKVYMYDSPEVQETMNKHLAAQDDAMVTPISISILLPTRGRPELLKMAVMALDHLSSNNNKITYCIATDKDDVAGNMAAESLAKNGNVNILMQDRVGGIGKLYNDLAKANPADAYCCFADDVIPLVQDWDVLIAKGIQEFPVFAWHDQMNPNFPTYPIIGKAWYEASGQIYPEHFAFWYNDTWLNEVVSMVTGRRIPIAMNVPLGGRRGKTIRMRDLGVWCDFFRITRDDRLVEAEAIGEKLGIPKPQFGRLSIDFEKQDLFMARNIERFENVFGEGLPPTPEYLEVLEKAKKRLGITDGEADGS